MSAPEPGSKSLDGLPAKHVRALCGVCKGATFLLLGPAPPGTKHGDIEDHRSSHTMVTMAECTQCGEQLPFVSPMAM